MFKPSTVILAVVLLLGPLFVAELGVRALIAAERLPYAPASSEEATLAFANLERLGKPDVLVLGTSSIRNALQPDVLEGLVAADSGREIRVQGVAQGGLSLIDQRLIVKGLAARDLLPETVILGLTPSTITGKGLRNRAFTNSELGRSWSGCGDLEAVEAALCQLGQRSALWRWRGRPERILSAIKEGMPTTLVTDERLLNENGWTSEGGVAPKRLPRLVAVTMAKLPQGVPQAADMAVDFEALIAELREHGTTILPVALPYAPPLEEALVERNSAWRDELDAGYAGLSDVADIDIVHVREFGDWWRAKSSNDLRHLSREGAEQLTRQLWTMPEFREPLLEGLASTD